MSLFRKESEQARAREWLGRIVLARPVSFAFLTAFALGVGIALAAFFTFGEYTRKARLTGVLAPVQGVVQSYSSPGDLAAVRGACQDHPSALSRLLLFASDHVEWSRTENGELLETRASCHIISFLAELLHWPP